MKSNRSTNVLLAMIAGLLALNLMIKTGATPDMASAASAQPAPAAGAPFNSSEFARRTADGITELNQRMSRLESRFDRPLQVRVTESVPLQVIGLPTKAESAEATK
ncbi:MAG: hypothetical protein K2X32_13475 [Phycisphaerales bacterium]|nr:hypothetical protein [Phycisphaerales bacterium]